MNIGTSIFECLNHVVSGNGEIKSTSFPFFAFHPNFSFVFVDKFLAKNQSQTGSGFLACSLGAEILVDPEQPLDGLFWNCLLYTSDAADE